MVFAELLGWAQVFVPFGVAGLVAVAFVESSFFPVPPDVILIPLATLNPELALLYAAITTIGSVLGALLGYYIGLKGGRPVLVRMVGERKVAKAEHYFNRHGSLAIAVAAFSPIPYKVFTIAAGAFRHSIKELVLVSLLARGARFFLEAAIIMVWGSQIVEFFTGPFEVVTIVITVIVIAAYVIWRRLGRASLLHRGEAYASKIAKP